MQRNGTPYDRRKNALGRAAGGLPVDHGGDLTAHRGDRSKCCLVRALHFIANPSSRSEAECWRWVGQ